MLNRLYNELSYGLKEAQALGVDQLELLSTAIAATGILPGSTKECGELADSIKLGIKHAHTKLDLSLKYANITDDQSQDDKKVSNPLAAQEGKTDWYIKEFGLGTLIRDGYMILDIRESKDISESAKRFFLEAAPYVSEIRGKEMLALADCYNEPKTEEEKKNAPKRQSDDYWDIATGAITDPKRRIQVLPPKPLKLNSNNILTYEKFLKKYPDITDQETAIKMYIKDMTPVDVGDRVQQLAIGNRFDEYYLLLVAEDNKHLGRIIHVGPECHDLFRKLTEVTQHGVLAKTEEINAMLANIPEHTCNLRYPEDSQMFSVGAVLNGFSNANAVVSYKTAFVTPLTGKMRIMDLGKDHEALDPATGDLVKASTQFILANGEVLVGEFKNFDAAYKAAVHIVENHYSGNILTGFDPYMIVGTKTGWFKVIDRDNDYLCALSRTYEEANTIIAEIYAFGGANEWAEAKWPGVEQQLVQLGLKDDYFKITEQSAGGECAPRHSKLFALSLFPMITSGIELLSTINFKAK